MKRITAVISAVMAVAFCAISSAHAAESGGYYCPPGAKFCPAPGADNTAFNNTHYGMDASTGRVTAYTGPTVQAADNSHLETGETLVLVAPNVSAENIFVPPEVAFGGTGPSRAPYIPPAPVQQMPAPAAVYSPSPYPAQPQYVQPVPARTMAPAPVVAYGSPYPAPQQTFQPVPVQVPAPAYQQPRPMAQTYQAPAPQPRQMPRVAANHRDVEPHSEVANQTSRRAPKENIANDDKIPWWKGGMWRNKKDKDDADASKSKSKSKSDSKSGRDDRDDTASRPSASTAASSRSSRSADDDSMWDDEEYDGYNPDGTFGRPAGATAQRRNQPDPNDNPYTAPFGGPNYDNYGGSGASGGYSSGPQQPVPEPYGTPQNQGTASFLSDPYSDPSYGSASTYSQPSYAGPTYSDPSGGVDMSHYDSPTSYGAVGQSDPYGSSYSAPYDSGAAASSWGGSDPWGGGVVAQTPQSPYQANPSVDAQGSPQFENAVRMVKDNRFSEAKSILTSETSRNPSNAAAWRWLADCHYNLLELDDAINCYQRSIERDPNDYYALRGQGFAYLHRGHEQWRRMQDEVARGQKETAAATFAQAHENYKKSLELLGLCLRRAPNDGEAIYGEAMAAEGASRKLYSNAISYLKLGPDQRERAELFASNCITVINKGVERSRERAKQNPGEAGPRALLGGLYLRKAILYHQLGKNDLALIELRNSRDVQQSIIDEIDKNNPTALKNIREVESYWEDWGGNR